MGHFVARAMNTTLHTLRKRGFAVVAALVYTFLLKQPVDAAGLIPCEGLNCTVDDFFVLFARIFNYLIGLSAIVLVLMIIWSGIQMLIFYVSETPEQNLTSAKYSLTRAIWGFIIIVIAYLIVSTLIFSILGVNPGGPVGAILQKVGL